MIADAVPVSTPVSVDGAVVDAVAVQLGLDPADREQINDVAAVGMTRLAWRDSPVEDWHSIRYRRIGDAEMMRANAATTRPVRAAVELVCAPDGGFRRAEQVLAAPGRRLPDGRTVAELAPGPRELDRYRAHVVAYCMRWDAVAAQIGVDAILTLLACRGATFNWDWWLSTGWPSLVDEFIRRLYDPQRWGSDQEEANRRRLGDPPGGLTSEELRSALLAGPDQLDTATAEYCLRAGLSLRPQDCGLPPVRRRLLPTGYFDLVDIYASCSPGLGGY